MSHSTIDPHTGAGHGSVKSYAIGLVISIALTLLAFGALMADGHFGLGRTALMVLIAVCAVAQILVQLICFMHMGSSEQWWNRTSFIFTILTIAILLGGSLWVMHHLHANMHPDMNHVIQQSHTVPAAPSSY